MRGVRSQFMSLSFQIRVAREDDAEYLLEIYRPFVENTAISFEVDVPSVGEFAKRISSALNTWAWLVAEINSKPVGYAYGTAHRPREAYRYSVETSAYIHEDFQRQGIASSLYTQLLRSLGEQGYGNAYAGITLPNEASMKFHKSLGFESIGVFPRVGKKFGHWHDVAWLHKPLTKFP